jgi:hypothetical protein
LGAALFTAGVAGTFGADFFAAFLTFAQRAFCASAIFARASALTVRFAAGLAADFAGMELVALSDKFARDGRPCLRSINVSVLAKSAFAFSSREICASISIMMSFVFMDPLPSSIYVITRTSERIADGNDQPLNSTNDNAVDWVRVGTAKEEGSTWPPVLLSDEEGPDVKNIMHYCRPALADTLL